MKKRKGCRCSSEFDAEAAYRKLSEKYNDLADYVINQSLEKDGQRTVKIKKSFNRAEPLIKIVGGERVEKGDYPECCLIGSRNPGGFEWFCTGVLVDRNIVLTAAHCYDPSIAYVVALNTINQNSLTDAEIINVRKATPHPQYSDRSKIFDIAVLILNGNANTHFVEQATSLEINRATSTTLVGFGNDDFMSTRGFGIKRKVTVDIKSIRRIENENLDNDETDFGYESDMEFVAGGNGFDSCNGDSGGPAYITVNGKKKLAGLTSRSILNSGQPCGEGGIYTRVDVHKNFIENLKKPVRVAAKKTSV